jgi:hypothetical protein
METYPSQQHHTRYELVDGCHLCNGSGHIWLPAQAITKYRCAYWYSSDINVTI